MLAIDIQVTLGILFFILEYIFYKKGKRHRNPYLIIGFISSIIRLPKYINAQDIWTPEAIYWCFAGIMFFLYSFIYKKEPIPKKPQYYF